MSLSLMKLVSVNAETLTISKNIAQTFKMLDRVPLFLEIDAANMPFPCKIFLRPNFKKHGYSKEDQDLIMGNLEAFLSTKTKNPSNRNNQLTLEAPCKRAFNFAPVSDGGALSGFSNRIYICLNYDLSGIDVV
jgi:hypothetical protein